MNDNIHLNIFTNCLNNYDHLKYCIKETYNSFISVFGIVKSTIWCDYHPNKNIYNDYTKYINSLGLNDIRKCESLSHGYIKAISSKYQFNFMLEHDWLFKKDNIKDTLKDITDQMRKSKIVHLRFNKFSNNDNLLNNTEFNRWQGIREYNDIISYMSCSSASNNPHIVNTQLYKKYCLPLIKRKSGPLGIEHSLIDTNFNFSIYGNKTLSPTIYHLDGRLKIETK